MAKYPKYWEAHVTQEAKNDHNLVLVKQQSIIFGPKQNNEKKILDWSET